MPDDLNASFASSAILLPFPRTSLWVRWTRGHYSRNHLLEQPRYLKIPRYGRQAHSQQQKQGNSVYRVRHRPVQMRRQRTKVFAEALGGPKGGKRVTELAWRVKTS